MSYCITQPHNIEGKEMSNANSAIRSAAAAIEAIRDHRTSTLLVLKQAIKRANELQDTELTGKQDDIVSFLIMDLSRIQAELG